MATDWIKMRKSLWNDPRVLSVTARLQQANPTVTKLTVIGALFGLWSLADTHGESFRGLSANLIDSEVGISGFCEALPPDWFRVRRNGIELPNYEIHNGTTAKSRALSAKRVARHRAKTGNADVTLGPLPDQTRTRPEKTREKKPPPTTVDASAIRAYLREEVGYTLDVVVVQNLLLDFGLVAVADVAEHLASRRPSHRKAKNPAGLVTKLAQDSIDSGLGRDDYEYEPFANWRARRDSEVAKVGGRG